MDNEVEAEWVEEEPELSGVTRRLLDKVLATHNKDSLRLTISTCPQMQPVKSSVPSASKRL